MPGGPTPGLHMLAEQFAVLAASAGGSPDGPAHLTPVGCQAFSIWRFFRDLDASWELGPDERWRLCYRIECEGIPDRKFSIVLGTEDGKLTVLLEDPACWAGTRAAGRWAG